MSRFSFRPLAGALAALLVAIVALPAQQRAGVDRAALQRLLVAEDARGTGPEGIAPLLEGMRGTDSLLRRVAVRGMGRFQRPEFGRLLLPVLADPLPAVRVEAANAIAQSLKRERRGAPASAPDRLSVQEAETALTAALASEQHPLVVAALAQSVGRLPLGDSVQARHAERAISARAGGGLSFGIVHGFYTLARARRLTGNLTPETLALMRETVRTSPDTLVRRLATMTLVSAAALDSATVEVASRDRDDQVRRFALFGVVGMSPTNRAAVLRRGFADTSIVVRAYAVTASRLGMAGQRIDCSMLLAATRDRHPYVVQTAIDTLGAPCLDSTAVATRLAELVTAPRTGVVDHRWQMSAHALYALSRVDRARAAPLAERAAASPVWGERLYVAKAAAEIGNVDLLRRLANDANHNVQELALVGLARHLKHDADDIFIAGLKSPGFQVSLAAATALQGTASPRALPALLDAFDELSAKRSENSRDSRAMMLRRIGELGSQATAARLERYVADFDSTVADTVAAQLSRWKGVTVTAKRSPLPILTEPLAEVFLSSNLRLRVTMKASSGGQSFTIKLFPDETPATIARLARLAREKYFEGLVLQRVEGVFVVQGGGPDGSEYVGDSAMMRDEYAMHSQFRGTLGISARGTDTGDAQWYINLADNYQLDHLFSNFGQIVAGLAAAEQILENDAIAKIEVIGGR